MAGPVLTAIVPSCDHARWLDRALAGVRAQAPGVPWEVVLLDDASRDDSPDRLRAWAAAAGADLPVRLELAPARRGVSASFQRGLELARGEWVAFCCSDDRWHPDHLAGQLAALAASPGAVASFGAARVVDEEDRPRGAALFRPAALPDPRPELYRRGNHLCFSAAVFRREAALAAGGFDPELRVLQDYDLWLRLLRRGGAIAAPAVTVDFRWHGGNASGRAAELERRRDLTRVLGRALEEDPLLAGGPLREAARKQLRRAHLALARAARGPAERSAELARARSAGLSAWRWAWERLR